MSRVFPSRIESVPVGLADLFSYAPAGVGVGRVDPFWDGVWQQGSGAVWFNYELLLVQERAGLVRVPKKWRLSWDEALAVVAAPRFRSRLLGVLGVLHQWRTVSCEQLSVFTGWASFGGVGDRDVLLVALFRLGVIDFGSFVSGVPAGDRSGAGLLVRPAASDVFDRVLLGLLSHEQWFAVTGGLGWDSGRQFDRHNVLSAELGLRAAQFCEVGGVLGERFASWDLLFGVQGVWGSRAGDLVVVRPDGLRVVFELTANAGPSFERKVEVWAQRLAAEPLRSSGVVVVFVEASAVVEGRPTHRVRPQVFRRVAEAVGRFPGVPGDRVAERMGVVSWDQWFPGSGLGSAGFVGLEAFFPVGPVDDRWVLRSVLDPVGGVGFDPVFDAAGVVDRLGGLIGCPWWLRQDGAGVLLWPGLMSGVGWGRLPVLPFVRGGVGVRDPEVFGVPGLTGLPRLMGVDGRPGRGLSAG